MNKFLLILLLLLLSFLLISGCGEAKLLSEGDKAPGFSLTDLNDKEVSLKDILKDKEVLLNFWATWCPECIKEMPALNGFAKKYKNKIEIIGINLKESKEDVLPFIKNFGIEYKILLDINGKATEQYNIIRIPTNVLINKQGLIKKKNLDVREMESYLNK